jgi:hypothetical protein
LAIERTVRGGRLFDANMAYEGTLHGVSAGADGLVLQVRGVSPEGSLEVLVLDPDGKPVAGVELRLSVPVAADARGSGHATTDDQGRARLTGLPVEELVLSAYGRPGARLAPPAPSRVVPRGQEIVLRCRPGVALSGVVLLPDGKPLVGSVRVTLTEGDVTLDAMQSGEGGRFALVAPMEPAAAVRLSCFATTDAGKHLSCVAEVRPGQQEIELQLKER